MPSYSYCLVQDCQPLHVPDGVAYVARCIGNLEVVLPVKVKEGDGVYYAPYWVDEDTVTVYGYIHKIQEARIKRKP